MSENIQEINIPEIPKKGMKKVQCECGMTVLYSNVASHKKHREHKKRIAKMAPHFEDEEDLEIEKLLSQLQNYLKEKKNKDLKKDT